MAFIRRDSHFHTYGDYLSWSRTSGDELIDGVAYVKELPAPSLSHQVIVLELGHQLLKRHSRGLRGRCSLLHSTFACQNQLNETTMLTRSFNLTC